MGARKKAARLKAPRLKTGTKGNTLQPQARPPLVSGPDITVNHQPAGRETLAAIDAEQAGRMMEARGDSPDIEVGHGTAGHETLAAIAADVQREAVRIARVNDWDAEQPTTGVRARMNTLGYEERSKRRETRGSSPELIEIEERPVGRNTLAALEEEAVANALGTGLRVTEPPPEQRAPQPPPSVKPAPSAALEVFEMATFVVRGTDLARLASEDARRNFVERNLLARLPVVNMGSVDRIDVTPWTVKNTVIVRVWCRIAIE